MFKPSYLSAQGPYGAYGAAYGADTAEAAEQAAQEKFDAAKVTCAKTIDPEKHPLMYEGCVQLARKAYEAALQGITQGLNPTTTTTTTTSGSPPPEDFTAKYKRVMTPEEYIRWTTEVKLKCGKRPSILKIKESTNYMICASKIANEILAARSGNSDTTKTKTALTAEKDYTWYYVGGVAGLLALTAGSYFLFFRGRK